MNCLGGDPGATLSPPPPCTQSRHRASPEARDRQQRLSVQPLEVAAHWLQRRSLTRARRTLTAVGARFVVGRADARGAPPPRRVVHLGADVEQDDDVEAVSNRISTAKYNVLTFLPLFLFSMVREWAAA